MEEDLQELKSKSGELDINQFPDILIICIPDYIKDMFQCIGEVLFNDQLLMVFFINHKGYGIFQGILILILLLRSSIILIQATLNL